MRNSPHTTNHSIFYRMLPIPIYFNSLLLSLSKLSLLCIMISISLFIYVCMYVCALCTNSPFSIGLCLSRPVGWFGKRSVRRQSKCWLVSHVSANQQPHPTMLCKNSSSHLMKKRLTS